MNTAAIRANRRRLLILTVIVLFCAAAYMLVEVDFSNPRLFAYAMKIRAPKLIVMLIRYFYHIYLAVQIKIGACHRKCRTPLSGTGLCCHTF